MRRKLFGLALAAMATAGTNSLGPMSLGSSQVLGGDREIAEAIIAKLKADRDAGTLENFNLDMKVDEGVVLFRGEVAGPQQRDLVLSASDGIDGVASVINELEVMGQNEPPTVTPPVAAKSMVADEPEMIEPPVATATEPMHAADVAAVEAPTQLIRPKAQLVAAAPPEPIEQVVAVTEAEPVQPVAVAAKAAPVEDDFDFSDALAAIPDSMEKSESMSGTPAPIVIAATPVEEQANIAHPAATWTNEETIAPVAANANADEKLTRSVAGAIGKAKSMGHLRSFGVDVNAYDGIVELVGTAASVQQRDLIGKIAGGAPGARGVRNLIEVESPTAPAPVAQTVSHRTPSPMPNMLAEPLPMERPVMAQPINAPGRMVAYPGQQVINGEMVVPGSVVTNGVPGGSMTSSPGAPIMGQPVPMAPAAPVGAPRYDTPSLPPYAWPGYAAHPNYAALSYPQQYSPSAFPYIGPFYPYPQVPLGWRKVSLEWDDGWWFLDFTDR
ncbi:MAG: BON domain-containing protein [Planctomycetota bacterium]